MQQQMACRVTRERASDVADNLGKISCMELTCHGNKSELISTAKMETRHFEDGYLGSEFPEICSHCGVMAAEVARR